MDSFDTKPFQYSSCTSEVSNCPNSPHNRSSLWKDEGNEVLQPLVVVKVEDSENYLYYQENDKTGCVDPLAHGFQQEASLFVQGNNAHKKAEPTSDKNLNTSCKNTETKLDISSCNKIVYENHDLAQKTPYMLRPETYICEFCNRCFASRAELLKHSHSHVELWLIKPFVCKVCGESFRSSSRLEEHEQIRELFRQETYMLRPETYICEFCNRCFASRAELLKHSHSHVELWLIKPFVCKVCGESFRSSSRLEEHEQIRELRGQEQAMDVCEPQVVESS